MRHIEVKISVTQAESVVIADSIPPQGLVRALQAAS